MFFALIAALSMVVPGWTASAAVDEAREPPLQCVLEINGKTFAMTVGEPLQLPGEFRSPTARITVGETREFSYGGVRFRYPARYGWEADTGDDGYRCWTMDGGQVVLMFFRTDEEMTLVDYRNGLYEQFGKDKCKSEASSRALGGKGYTGLRLTIDVDSTPIIQEAYLLPGTGKSRLLVLQDAPEEGQRQSSEFRHCLQLLEESFSFNSVSR